MPNMLERQTTVMGKNLTELNLLGFAPKQIHGIAASQTVGVLNHLEINCVSPQPFGDLPLL
ncbi:hypothetical protein ACP70R_041105 [Stipagrostis hirtigluma subsp. patula]